ncbi:Biotin synthase [uncultured Paludibacter sp.]|uniref:Biotin synthase n=1 Tax=uncultured Paludibacter sp. TaxID=497635 RepID=A0A653ACU5_9BACT|nr:Biotin synthase [uncultured Paludibacter sp.]
MHDIFKNLLTSPSGSWRTSDIVQLLSAKGEDEKLLFDFASDIKQKNVGNSVYLRGLIELSNVCEKDCYYCGIRKSNSNVKRYSLSEEEILEAIRFAYEKGYGSVAIQSGEIQSNAFTEKISRILQKAREISNGELGVTLSCGEQTEETYQKWFENGAQRYLLRIESSNQGLYKKLHPDDAKHRFEKRLQALQILKKTGYQVGTGVMIGLPFQTVENLADDLLFMKNFDIVMCGMGPYIEHHETPLYQYKDTLLPLKERLGLSLKMVAVLRILMPDINIAATTALQTIEKSARIKAIQIGANVMMPNITPKKYRDDYFLYENKPVSTQNDEDELHFLDEQLKNIGHRIGYFQQGNSKHFKF